MRRRAIVRAGLLAVAVATSAVLGAQVQPRFPQAPPPAPARPAVAVKAPVYILLQTSIDDIINTPVSMDRLPRALKVAESLGARAAAYHPVCLVQFNGIAANRLGAEDYSTRGAEAVKDAARRGVIEIGYDGVDEPTLMARPQPNLRGADTPEKRWLARLQAHEWFLREWKHPVTGEPDPSRAGGFKRVLEVFGRVDFVRGATFEPWYAAELVHALEALGARPALVGFLENTAYPARNFDGYRAGAPTVAGLLAPDERCSPEVFWLDSALRVSDYGTMGGRVFNAYEGPEALEKYLESLDRSQLHVVQVRLGHPAVYVKPGFGAKNYQTALEYAYDNPKAPNLPAAAKRTIEETAALYAKEDAVVEWLVGSFFPANPGSRFVSIGRLTAQAGSGSPESASQVELAEAVAFLLAHAKSNLDELPPFVKAGRRFFSLADMFGLLVNALGDTAASGSRQAAVPLPRLLGPVSVEEPGQVAGARVSVAALARQCASLRAGFAKAAWAPIPGNAVPPVVTVGNVRLTAAQFLRAMADAYQSPPGAAEIEVRSVKGTTLIGAMFPMTRPRTDGGGHWTLKPAPIRFSE